MKSFTTSGRGPKKLNMLSDLLSIEKGRKKASGIASGTKQNVKNETLAKKLDEKSSAPLLLISGDKADQGEERRKEKISKKVKEETKQRICGLAFDRGSNPYADEISQLREKVPNWKPHRFFQGETSKVRQREWKTLDDIALPLCEKYAWAVPDERALKILLSFSPLIEIGCGRGYWAKLLRDMGGNILAIDKYVSPDSAFTEIEAGGPERLREKSMKGRNLFLCYPDEQESIAAPCLDFFEGDYVVHVGESIISGTYFGPPQAPFGRTSSADFQVLLAEQFHCVLVASLNNRLPYSNDCISVWKRTTFVNGKEHAEDVCSNSSALESDVTSKLSNKRKNSGSSQGSIEKVSKKKSNRPMKMTSASSGKKSNEDEVEFIDMDQLALLREVGLDHQYSEEKESKWAFIPESELLPSDRAAPSFAHLL